MSANNQTLNKNKNIFDHRNCLSKEELISYANGSLTEREKHFVEKHLLDCELCSDALEGVLLLSDPLKLTHISNDLIRRLALQNPVSKKNKVRPVYLAAAAIVCLFIISGIYFAFIRNNQDLKSEMAVAPVKNEQLKPVASAPHSENELEKPTETTQIPGNSQISRETKNVSKPGLQKSLPQAISISSGTGADQKVNEVTVTEKTGMYNGTLAATEKAKEESQVMDDKKSIPAPEQPKMSADETVSAGNRESAGIENSPAAKNKVAVQMSEQSVKKSISTSSQDNATVDLRNVNRNMEVENFKDALKELKQLSKEYPGDMNIVYNTGLVYYKTNETSKALQSFDEVINSSDKKLFEDARLHKALTYVKMNDKQNARKILSYIIAEKGIYKERAEGILEQMDGN